MSGSSLRDAVDVMALAARVKAGDPFSDFSVTSISPPCATFGWQSQTFDLCAPGGGAFTPEHHMTFQPQKDQKAAKLVYKGSKSVNVEIPFSLKDVKLP